MFQLLASHHQAAKEYKKKHKLCLLDILIEVSQQFLRLYIIINTPTHNLTFASATFAQLHLPIPDLLPPLNLEI
jgi:hypothetical protein